MTRHKELSELYDLEKLKAPVNNVPLADRVATNAGYAHMYHLKKFAGLPEDILMNCVIEHGFYTMDGAYIFEIMQNVPSIITFSEFRKKILEREYDKKAIPVGPYIGYVEGILSEEDTETIHNENGRTLLVMPAHYSREESKIYDYEELFSLFEHYKKSFDRIMVSLPMFDLQRDAHKPFMERGYDVVSVGSGLDCMYLRRLRTLIDLSDAVLANAFTTGLVYSAYLGKPVYLFEQKITIKNEVKILYRTDETEIVDEFRKVSRDDAFGCIEAQTEWGKKYAGFDSIKDKEDLRKILLENAK